MILKSLLGVAAGVAVLAGIGYLTQDEETEESKRAKQEKIEGKEMSTLRAAPPFDAPDGFSWHEPRFFYILVLVPKGWNVREDEGKTSIFITKHNLTSATVFAVTCMPRKPKEYVPTFLKSYPGVLKRFGKLNLTEWETKELRGNFVKHTCSFEDFAPKGHVLVICNLIHNELTGTVYLVMFEAAKNNWDDCWATYGEVMTNNLLLPSSL